MVGAFSVGSISGGAFNPAVAVGAALMGLITWPNIWIFLTAHLFAGVLAAMTFQLITSED
jgi:aquaporin Z